MVISGEDMAEGELAAVAPSAPVIIVPGVAVVDVGAGGGGGGDRHAGRVSVGAKHVVERENLVLGTWWTEVREQCWLAGPTTVMLALQYLAGLTVISFVGLLGAQYLAAISLTNCLVGIIGVDVLLGLSSGLETLYGQAYGAKQYHLVGITLQRGITVLLTVCIPICFGCFYMAPILIAMGEDPQIATRAQAYGRWLLPAFPAHAILLPLVKFCQSQRIVVPLMCCAAFGCFLQFPLCFLLITKLQLGYRGGAMATSISFTLDTLILIAMLRFSPKSRKCFTPFSMEALHDLRGFFKYVLPAGFMTCLELWSYQILTLLAGWLPNTETEMAAFVIGLTLFILTKLLSMGLSIATSVRVSTELGAGQPHRARFAVIVSVMIVIVLGVIMAAMLLLLGNEYGHVFTREQEVLDLFSRTTPYIAALTVLNCCQLCLGGVLRGVGWQKWGAYANLGAYYGVGLPAAIILISVFHFDVRGLWIGNLLGVAVQTVALTIICLSANWENLSKEALDHIFSSQSSLPSTRLPLLDDKDQSNAED